MSTTDDPRGPGPAVPPASELDELASALHDGEGTAEESARAGEPEVAARVAAFARVSDAVGEPVPPVDDTVRDRAIAAALAAWGTSAPASDDASDGRRALDDLARRRRRRAALVRPLGIAAALLAAIAVGGVALRASGGDNDDAATEAATADADESAGADSGAGAARDETTMASGSIDLGAFGTVAELAAAFERDLAGRAAAGAEPTESSDAEGDDDAATEDGAAAAPQNPPAGSVLAALGCAPPDGTIDGPAVATVAGRQVVAYVVEDGSGRRVVVLDADGCSLVGEHPIAG